MPVEDRLFHAMDKAAISMIAVLENVEKDAAGKDLVSLRERMSTFELAMNWMAKREKMRPKEEEGAGVDVLKRFLEDPANIVDRLGENPQFIDALKAKGWLRPPTKKPGRPTLAQAEERASYAKAKGDPPEDDSNLRKLAGI